MAEQPRLVVFPARSVITMEPGLPRATAIAVRGDRIVGVGDMASLRPWLEAFPHEVDNRFADDVILPGFIDPHLHPSMAALLLGNEIAAPDPWDLPDRTVPAVPDRVSFLAAVRGALVRHEGAEPLIVWGWNRFWHGPITRTDLDAIAAEVPVVVIQRSFHEFVFNSAGLRWLNPPPEILVQYAHHVDLQRGHFFETGITVALAGLAPFLSERRRLGRGLHLVRELIQRGGVTTVADMLAGGVLGPEREWDAFREHLDGEDIPFRTLLVPPAHVWQRRHGDESVAALAKLPERNTRRLRWLKAIKTLGDGAFISQAMRLCEPGYIDGHHGEWITRPRELRAIIEPFWREGFDVYHHVNGDEGVDVALDVLEGLLEAHPRPDFRFNLEHFGIAREDQVRRMARLGATVSANGYYVHLFADRWAELGIGPERAGQITRLGSLARQGINLTLHSDLPMGPVRPLLAVSAAVTRQSSSGRVHGEQQRLGLELALRAVTIDAAWSLRMDREIGSLAAGKKADFTVLAEDPFEVEPRTISDIPVLATVFEGRCF